MSALTDKIRAAKQNKQAVNNNETFEYRLQDPPPVVYSQNINYNAVSTSQPQPSLDDLDTAEAFNLTRFVEASTEFIVNDVIVDNMNRELADIETKLEIIKFLKSIEKSLKKRANVLYAFKNKLQEASDELEEVGAYELKQLNTQEISHVNKLIESDKVSEVMNTLVKEQVDRLDDFYVES